MIALKLSKRVSKPKISINKKKKKFHCIKGLKKLFYLYLHNFVLTFIILISMMISGLISAVYITLSLIYLMKSSSLILGKKCDYYEGFNGRFWCERGYDISKCQGNPHNCCKVRYQILASKSDRQKIN